MSLKLIYCSCTCIISEVKAILEPFYKEIQKNVEESKMEQNLKFMHPDGVVVQKGKAAHYGLERELNGAP